MPKDPSSRFIRRTFLAGLLILIPLFVTYVLIAFLFNIFTNAGAPLMKGCSICSTSTVIPGLNRWFRSSTSCCR